MQAVGQNPVGLLHQVLKPVELLMGFLVVARQDQRQIIGDRLDGAERLAKIVRDVAQGGSA